MNKFAKLLADADPETVAKLQAFASIETAMAAQRQANDMRRIADALEKIVAGTVGRREDEEQQLNETIAALFESNRKSG
jgi:hypothetical protein